jgi:hypothetical protein
LCVLCPCHRTARRNHVLLHLANLTVGHLSSGTRRDGVHSTPGSGCSRAGPRQRSRHLSASKPASTRMAVRMGCGDRARHLVRAPLDHVVNATPSGTTRAATVCVAGSAQHSCRRPRAGAVRARDLCRLRGRPLLHVQLRPDVHLRDLLGRGPRLKHPVGQLVQRLQPVACLRAGAELGWCSRARQVESAARVPLLARPLAGRRGPVGLRLA